MSGFSRGSYRGRGGGGNGGGGGSFEHRDGRGGGRGGGGSFRGGGRGGGFSNRNSNALPRIDSRTQQEIFQKLCAFRDDPSAPSISFPSDFSSEDRKFVHKVCHNFGFTSKSSGNRNVSGGRQVWVFKGKGDHEEDDDDDAEGGDGVRKETVEEREMKKDLFDRSKRLLPLSESLRKSIDSSFSKFSQLGGDEIFRLDGEEMKKKKIQIDEEGEDDGEGGEGETQNTQNSNSSAFHSTNHRIPPPPNRPPSLPLLPVTLQMDRIINTIRENSVVVISASTGSGKSTKVPQFLLENLHSLFPNSSVLSSLSSRDHWPPIIITQPRRIAAVTLAERVAWERGETVGQTIGYQIRLNTARSPNTFVLFCSAGVLLRRMALDPMLKGVHVVIIDEAHERALIVDFLLILMRELCAKRPHDLKVVVMSATLNASLFSTYFSDCPHVYIEGIYHQVTTLFLEDVMELVGSQEIQRGVEGAMGKGTTVQNRQKDMAKEKKLSEFIQNTMIRQMKGEGEKERGGEEKKKDEGIPMNSLEESLKNMMISSSDSLSSPPLPKGKPKDAPIDWVDNFSFTPSYTLPGEEEGEKNAVSSSSVSSSSSSGAALSQSEIDDSLRYMPSSLEYSPSTVSAIQRIESEGLDFIDYDMVVNTVIYICKEFGGEGMKKLWGDDGGKGKSFEKENPNEITMSNGSILVFISSWEDIQILLEMLSFHPVVRANPKGFLLLPLHSTLPPAQQKEVFKRAPNGVRKIILSTNISETSVTIDDVVFVVDCGKLKEKAYDPHSKMSALVTTWISQSAAKQRSGRAGRSRPGVCFRLYSKGMFKSLSESSPCEMLRSPLEEIALQCKTIRPYVKCGDFLKNAIEPPAPIAVKNAVDLLKAIGAFTPSEVLTPLGHLLSTLPLDPRLGKLILWGAAFQCLDALLTISACLSFRDPFVMPAKEEKSRCSEKKSELSDRSESDMLTALNAMNQWENLNSSGERYKTSQFCREFFLNSHSMQIIQQYKRQFKEILIEGGFLTESPESQTLYNVNSKNIPLIRFLLVIGLSPNISKIEVKGGGPNGGKSKGVMLITSDHMACRIHPSSINWNRPETLRPLIFSTEGAEEIVRKAMQKAGKLIKGGEESKDSKEGTEGGEGKGKSSPHHLWPLVVFREISRSSSVFIKDTTVVDPLTVLMAIQREEEETKENTENTETKEKEKAEEEDIDTADADDLTAGIDGGDDDGVAEDDDAESEESPDDQEYFCDVCKVTLSPGMIRWACGECPSYDQCHSCHEREKIRGNPSHPHEMIPVKVGRNSKRNDRLKGKSPVKSFFLKAKSIDSGLPYWMLPEDSDRISHLKSCMDWMVNYRIVDTRGKWAIDEGKTLKMKNQKTPQSEVPRAKLSACILNSVVSVLNIQDAQLRSLNSERFPSDLSAFSLLPGGDDEDEEAEETMRKEIEEREKQSINGFMGGRGGGRGGGRDWGDRGDRGDRGRWEGRGGSSGRGRFEGRDRDGGTFRDRHPQTFSQQKFPRGGHSGGGGDGGGGRNFQQNNRSFPSFSSSSPSSSSIPEVVPISSSAWTGGASAFVPFQAAAAVQQNAPSQRNPPPQHNNQQRNGGGGGGGAVQCFRCGNFGHIANRCTQRDDGQRGGNNGNGGYRGRGRGRGGW